MAHICYRSHNFAPPPPSLASRPQETSIHTEILREREGETGDRRVLIPNRTDPDPDSFGCGPISLKLLFYVSFALISYFYFSISLIFRFHNCALELFLCLSLLCFLISAVNTNKQLLKAAPKDQICPSPALP